MKQRKTIFLKLCLFLLGISFIIYSCQKEDDSNSIEPEAITQKSTTKTVSAKDIPEVMSFIATKSADFKFLLDDSTTSEGMNRSHEDNLVMTTLLLDEIKQVTNAYQKSNYTFKLIKQSDSDGNYFLNLVVKEYKDTFYMYIVKFVPDEVWLNNHSITNDFIDFTGIVYFYSDEGKYLAKTNMLNGGSNTTERHPCDDETGDVSNNGGSEGSGDGGDIGSEGGSGSGGWDIYVDCYTDGGCWCDGDLVGSHDCSGTGTSTCVITIGGGNNTSANQNTETINDFLRHPCEGSSGGGGIQNCTPDPNNPCDFPMQLDENCDCKGADAIENGEVGIVIDKDDLSIVDDCLGLNFDQTQTVVSNSLETIMADYIEDNGCNAQSQQFLEDAIEAKENGGEVDFIRNVILDSTFVNDQRINCVYNKLLESESYDNLLNNTFGDNEGMNLTFKVVDNIPPIPPSSISPAGITKSNVILDGITGEIKSYNSEILINKNYTNSVSAIAVSKIILHETIHAYLGLKRINCNLGTPINTLIEEIDNSTLEELLNNYYATSCPSQEQHEFMFDNILPSMSLVLQDMKDLLIPPEHQAIAELEMFIDESNPTGPETPWNWNEFYKYFSMGGLQNTDAFEFEILPITSPKYQNFFKYSQEYGIGLFRKPCID